jgi:hypothetical protein
MFLVEFDKKNQKNITKPVYKQENVIYNSTYASTAAASIDDASVEDWNRAYRNINVTLTGMNYETK